jgi:sigma-54-dependent transcriptional regulator
VLYDFPGNIREMRNALERSVLMCEDHGVILPEHLPTEIQQAQIKLDEMSLALCESSSLKSVTGRYESMVICRKLMEFGGNQTKTAESLQLSRRALINKMNKYNIRSADDSTAANDMHVPLSSSDVPAKPVVFRRIND